MANIISLEYLWKKGFKIIHSGAFLFSLVDKDDEEIIKSHIVPNNNIKEEDLTIKDVLRALTNDIQVNIKALEKEKKSVILKTKNNSILLKKNRDNHLSLLDDEILFLKSILDEAVSKAEITTTKKEFMIDLTGYKPLEASTTSLESIEKEIKEICSFIECNFDRTIYKVVAIKEGITFALSSHLDDAQIKKLRDSFIIIKDVENYSSFFDFIIVNI